MTLYAYPMIVLLTLTSILAFPFIFAAYKLFTRWTHARIMRALISEFNVYRWAGRMLLDAAAMRRRGHLAAGRATTGRNAA